MLVVMIVAPRITGRTCGEHYMPSAAKQQLSGFSNAVKMFELDNRFYPSNEQGLCALIRKPETGPQPACWRKYLDADEMPRDPWGNEYDYAYPGVRDPDSFDIRSRGPDGLPDTPDDIWKP